MKSRRGMKHFVVIILTIIITIAFCIYSIQNGIQLSMLHGDVVESILNILTVIILYYTLDKSAKQLTISKTSSDLELFENLIRKTKDGIVFYFVLENDAQYEYITGQSHYIKEVARGDEGIKYLEDAIVEIKESSLIEPNFFVDKDSLKNLVENINYTFDEVQYNEKLALLFYKMHRDLILRLFKILTYLNSSLSELDLFTNQFNSHIKMLLKRIEMYDNDSVVSEAVEIYLAKQG